MSGSRCARISTSPRAGGRAISYLRRQRVRREHRDRTLACLDEIARNRPDLDFEPMAGHCSIASCIACRCGNQGSGRSSNSVSWRAILGERAELFLDTADAGVPVRDAALIEKDFWVCWVLGRLFRAGAPF